MSSEPTNLQSAKDVDPPVASRGKTPNYFGKAVAFGIVGAIIGTLIYAVFFGLTRISIGYFGLVVAFLIAKAMMMGSGGRGGAKYQSVAMLLTYLSIATTPVLVDCWDTGIDAIAVGYFLKALLFRLEFPVRALSPISVTGIVNLLIFLISLALVWFMTSDTSTIPPPPPSPASKTPRPR